MIVARRVIEAARDRRPEFDRKKHPDSAALRFLSDYHRDLLGKVAIENPSLVWTALTIELPFTDPDTGEAIDFEDGYPLPEHTDVLPDGIVTFSESGHIPPTTPLAIMAAENRLIPRLRYSAYTENGRLYLVGEEDDPWRDIASIQIRYVAEPLDLVSLEDVLEIPDAGYLACVEAVAAFFGTRLTPPIDLTRRAAAAEDRFLETLRQNRPARRIPKYRRKW